MKKTAGGNIKVMATRWSNLVNPKKAKKPGRKRK